MRDELICLAALIAGVSPANATPVQTEAEARAECSGDPGGEAGMRDCLDRKAKASATELRRTESNMRGALPKVDIWPRFVTEAKTRFNQSSRAFTRYRAIKCAFNDSLAGGAAGNSREIMRLACVAELNWQRVEQLRLQIADVLARGK
jgi:Lysozyme inhibitor LprI